VIVGTSSAADIEMPVNSINNGRMMRDVMFLKFLPMIPPLF
jgi:hypothetical protein